jgi:hypothetical protein
MVVRRLGAAPHLQDLFHRRAGALEALLDLVEHVLKLGLLEQIFLVPAGSLIVFAWAGLLLAEWSLFTPGRLAAAVATLTAALALTTRRRLRLRPGPTEPADLALAGIACFALVVYFPLFEYVLGGKDPGVYVNAGVRVARQGNLLYADPLVRELPAEARSPFFRDEATMPAWSQPRHMGHYLESPANGSVVSHGFHLYPVWIGIPSSLFDQKRRHSSLGDLSPADFERLHRGEGPRVKALVAFQLDGPNRADPLRVEADCAGGGAGSGGSGRSGDGARGDSRRRCDSA